MEQAAKLTTCCSEFDLHFKHEKTLTMFCEPARRVPWRNRKGSGIISEIVGDHLGSTAIISEIIWDDLGSSGLIWIRLVSSESVWDQLELFGIL